MNDPDCCSAHKWHASEDLLECCRQIGAIWKHHAMLNREHRPQLTPTIASELRETLRRLQRAQEAWQYLEYRSHWEMYRACGEFLLQNDAAADQAIIESNARVDQEEQVFFSPIRRIQSQLERWRGHLPFAKRCLDEACKTAERQGAVLCISLAGG